MNFVQKASYLLESGLLKQKTWVMRSLDTILQEGADYLFSYILVPYI